MSSSRGMTSLNAARDSRSVSNDNAHLERFNRTIQGECLGALPKDTKIINRNLPKYLRYYNEKRHHFGLNLQTPLQVVRSY